MPESSKQHYRGREEISSPSGGMGNFGEGRDFSSGGFSSAEEWFWPFKPFSKLKTPFCQYWTSNENGTGATTTAKNEVFVEL